MLDRNKINPRPFRRFNISLLEDLAVAVDCQAKADYITRSGLIRNAHMEYLRPIDGQMDECDLFADPEVVVHMLQRRKLRASLQRVKETGRVYTSTINTSRNFCGY